MSESTQNVTFDGQDDPQWYKDAIIYEVHVRAFADSDDDGIGDFAGLTQKLDYLKDLGVTAIWLLPFYPSPLLDDGYDIADYTEVHPSYGTLRDARIFIREAHRRGLRVITELVCNHTSDQHPWFQRARRAPRGSWQRDFYVWSDSPEKYKEARIIFKDFETSNWSWDPVAAQYYWHRFYRHQPDLNFENPRVMASLRKALDFWLAAGVDGLRLDAVPYLYEREGTSCENLPETYDFLRQLRSHIDNRFAGRMLLAEANQWPEDAVAYFGEGDMCQMAFHFPLMPRLFMSIHMEDRFPIIDIVRQTPAIPDNCQWAVFLRNHDELTLEMVTDEERDYMYRVYAAEQRMRINLGIRRRLAPLLGNHRRRVELMNGLLFALPGTPVLYYGDEIGMGDNVYLGDRNGVRTPMQWSADRNAGFSRANPQKLFLPVIIDPEYHYETVNVEAQQQNPHSLLWWTKRLIALRKRYKAFSRGAIEFLQPENRRVLAFIRSYEDENILVIANLSRFVQAVSLDLAQYRGMTPMEIFGGVEMPPVTDAPYFLTLGPHSFYWFSLEPQRVVPGQQPWLNEEGEPPLRVVRRNWEELFTESESTVVSAALPGYLGSRRWFAGKGRRVRFATMDEAISFRRDGADAFLTFINVGYTEGTAETYLLPFAYESGEAAVQRLRQSPETAFLRLKSNENGEEGILFDATGDPGFAQTLLRMIERRQHLRTSRGEITGVRTSVFHPIRSSLQGRVSLLRGEQSNSSINFDDQLLLKLFRRLEPGANPDYEIGRFLSEHDFSHAPKVAGAIEYTRRGEEPTTLAILHEFVHKESDAWEYTLDALRDFFDETLASGEAPASPPINAASLLALAENEPSSQALAMLGAYAESTRLLGQRTAELHIALARSVELPAFAPEPYTPYYQRGLYQSMRNLTTNSFALLRSYIGRVEEAPPEAVAVLEIEDDVLASFRRLVGRSLTSQRIRTHGDYHLGQVLYTGNDFVITDFEGEPARSLTERRIRRSPLRDVAGMLRSYDYAVHTALQEQRRSGLNEEAYAAAAAWGRFWQSSTGAIFLRSYLETMKKANLLTAPQEEVELLLDVFVLEKAVYELAYELNNRPDWLAVPLQGIIELVQAAK
ncbi:MAG TPA: maltose alpha-D-glucosyltransferase [Dehalococcoidia bacterium]|nr:maltose alpha-D-glucosyltransferase [Dehalococcoidia bacterium]